MIQCRDLSKVYLPGENETVALEASTCGSTKANTSRSWPSGSGKSTLMHILGALDTPTSGDYFFEGKDISSYSDEELADIRRTRIGFVFQAFNLLPRATVLRNVVLPLVYAGVSRRDREDLAKRALELAGLEEFALGPPVQPALGRPDPAGCDSEGADQRSGPHPGRRAHRQPGYQDRRHHPRGFRDAHTRPGIRSFSSPTSRRSPTTRKGPSASRTGSSSSDITRGNGNATFTCFRGAEVKASVQAASTTTEEAPA